MALSNLSRRISSARKTSVLKQYWKGTQRTIPPAITVRKIMPLTKKFGITRIANVTGLDWLGLPVVMVCRPNSRSLSVSQGKGLTLDAAKASGLMESIELYHAEHISLPMQKGSFHHIATRFNVVSIERLPYVNWLQHKPDRELLWVEGHDLIGDQPIWIPYECVTADTVSHHLPGQSCFGMSSNGLASGNHLLEAIVHAICEVVERDATTLWFLCDLQVAKSSWVDIESWKEPEIKQLIAQFHKSGIQTLVWNITSDVGIPTFFCLLHEGASDPSRLVYTSSGMGCHLSADIALLRAITEAAQSRLTLIAGARDDMFRDQYEPSRFRHSDLLEYCSLRASGKVKKFSRPSSSLDGNTFNADLELILGRLKTVGIEQVIVIPLTGPELPYQVVKVLIPGLEAHDDHPLYCPGPRAHRMSKLVQ
ncbi:MAG: YcaO-like protein [Nitrospira sp.]|jgi:ribosomal protein S12 methylthiotransferase accessory factor|nr:MAG: YcaO-like protein [Nitrospira sp.]